MSEHVLITGLYVPGDRAERFDKAVSSGAELVILDLEDAVAPERKAAARENVLAWLDDRAALTEQSPVIQVRVNSPADADLAVIAGSAARFELRVPKVEALEDVEAIVRLAPGRAITALLETPLGIENALQIARHPAVTRLAIGESDLASALGSRSAGVMAYARNRVLFASLAAGLDAPMMSAFPAIRDLDGLRADTEAGRNDGWVGRTAIHPAQLPVIREAFASSPEELAWAIEVLAVTADGGVGTLASGDMVDTAMRGRAERILRRAPR